ncbi:hypothetical protein ACFVJ5_06970 [Nocardia sp. NPDC127606]|uniref:hypothetical protein n=1 Tax=Nocardia sp. NPDC127606 TaxID=3345406 RepID=UPI0036279000
MLTVIAIPLQEAAAHFAVFFERLCPVLSIIGALPVEQGNDPAASRHHDNLYATVWLPGRVSVGRRLVDDATSAAAAYEVTPPT